MMIPLPQSHNGVLHLGRSGGLRPRSTPALATANRNSTAAATSPNEDDDGLLIMKSPDVPRAKPIITMPVPCHSIAHSPRSTRRHMLATELRYSLRSYLVVEQQQKTTGATIGFRLWHSAHDMANLLGYRAPQQDATISNAVAATNISQMFKGKETSKNNSWNHYFDYDPCDGTPNGW